MPKSPPEVMAALRDEVFSRDGGCVWLGCDHPITYDNPLQLAHIRHRGMGGSEEANTADNTVTLCRVHHDVFDGRTGLGNGRWELGQLLLRLAGVSGGVT